MAPTGAARLLHMTKVPRFILDITLTNASGEPLPLGYFEPAAAESHSDVAVEQDTARAAGAEEPDAAPVEEAASSSNQTDADALHAGLGDDDTFLGLHRLLQTADSLERLAIVGDHIKVCALPRAPCAICDVECLLTASLPLFDLVAWLLGRRGTRAAPQRRSGRVEGDVLVPKALGGKRQNGTVGAAAWKTGRWQPCPSTLPLPCQEPAPKAKADDVGEAEEPSRAEDEGRLDIPHVKDPCIFIVGDTVTKLLVIGKDQVGPTVGGRGERCMALNYQSPAGRVGVNARVVLPPLAHAPLPIFFVPSPRPSRNSTSFRRRSSAAASSASEASTTSAASRKKPTTRCCGHQTPR